MCRRLRREDETRSGSPLCELTDWLLQATGRAEKLLRYQMRFKSIVERLAAIFVFEASLKALGKRILFLFSRAETLLAS